MTQPVAIKTVRFTSPLTGTQLRGLVQQVAGGGFTDSERYYDGAIVEIGQTSPYPFDQLRVVPGLGNPFFRLEDSYSEVLVTSHSWGGSVYAIGYSNSDVVSAVIEFATKLEQAAIEAQENGMFPEYTPPKAWSPFDEER